MTRQETESLLRYMLSMYPNTKISEQQFQNMVVIWTSEFKNETPKAVTDAFRAARVEYPDWMPTLPKIQHTLNAQAARVCAKSPEQEFKDSHCGKTQEEWKRMIDWEQSADGASKIKSYKEQFIKLIGEKR